MTNYVYRNNDIDLLIRLRDEYIDYIGREAKIVNGELVVFDRPQKKPTAGKRRPVEKEEAPRITKREEKFNTIPRT